MEPIKRYSLEDFTERHRADFDLHEPRPELWDALTARLDAEQPQLRIVTEPAPVMTSVLPGVEAVPTRPLQCVPAADYVVSASPVQPRLRSQRRWQTTGLAGALVALLLVAGLGEAWKSRRAEQAVAALPAGQVGSANDAALYLGDESGTMLASQGGPNGNARLDTAVHGMERYYAAQLAERQAQLGELTNGAPAEWVRELASLDSSYQLLRQELPRHPQPEVVLTAMNRNLQIRLDILDRQLELRGTDPLARTAAGGSEYSLADSRRTLADNIIRTNAH